MYLLQTSNSHVNILKDYEVHHPKKMTDFSDTSETGREAKQFALVSNLSPLIDLATWMICRATVLELFILSSFSCFLSIHIFLHFPHLTH